MSCGRALGDTDIRIVDADTGIEVGPGQTGEIWVAGSGRARGYWNKPEQSRETFEARLVNAPDAPGPFLRTGDIGFLHEGELFVCGRLKDMIIIRGQNIYPEDIEALARQVYPELRRNGVVAFASRRRRRDRYHAGREVARGRDMPDETEIVRVIREGLQVPVARVVRAAAVGARAPAPARCAGRAPAAAWNRQLEVFVDTAPSVAGLDRRRGGRLRTRTSEGSLRAHRRGGTTLFEAGIDSARSRRVLNWIKDG